MSDGFYARLNLFKTSKVSRKGYLLQAGRRGLRLLLPVAKIIDRLAWLIFFELLNL